MAVGRAIPVSVVAFLMIQGFASAAPKGFASLMGNEHVSGLTAVARSGYQHPSTTHRGPSTASTSQPGTPSSFA
jgi:hypothetical protein